MTPSIDDQAAQGLRQLNNPKDEPTGHFTGRCMRCGSQDLWDDNTAYGCNCCGGFWCGIEPRLVPDSSQPTPNAELGDDPQPTTGDNNHG